MKKTEDLKPNDYGVITIRPKKEYEQENGVKPKVCAYTRVSTDNEEQKHSLQNQIKYWEEKLKKPEFDFVEIFVDEGRSGTSDKRPEFQRMIKKALRGEIDVIYTKNISRFSRNVVDLLKYTRMLSEAGVDVVFDENGSLNLNSAGGQIMLTVLAGVAEMEVQNTSDHIKHTLNAKMEKGIPVGQPNPYGYDWENGELKINEDEAQWVRFIFEKYVEGWGGKTIANELTKRGVPTRRQGKKWYDTTILQIIKNEKYKGYLVQGKTITVSPIGKVRKKNRGIAAIHQSAEKTIPPIVSEELWEKAQKILDGRCESYADGRQRGNIGGSAHYAFSGLVYCGYCGGKLTRRTLGRANSKVPVWTCQRYIKEGKQACPCCKTIKEETLKQSFVSSLNAIMQPKEDTNTLNITLNKSELKKAIRDKNNTVKDIQKSLENNEKKIRLQKSRKSRLLDGYLDGTFSEDDIKEKTDEINNQLSILEQENAELNEKLKTQKNLADEQKKIIELIENEDISAFNEKILRALISRVEVGDVVEGPEEISWYYKGSAYKSNSENYTIGEDEDWTPDPERYPYAPKAAPSKVVSGNLEENVIPKEETTHVETVVRMTRNDIPIGDKFSVNDNSYAWETDEDGNRVYSHGTTYHCQNYITRPSSSISANDKKK